MIYGSKRSTLPASTDICGAKIIGDLGPQEFAHKPSVAELPCVSDSTGLRRAMQNRLPVEADDTDIRHREPAFLYQFADSRRLRARQRFFRLGKTVGSDPSKFQMRASACACSNRSRIQRG